MTERELRPLVLVVDDNEDQLVMLEALLDLEGYDVITASSVASVAAVVAAATGPTAGDGRASRVLDALVADMGLGDGTAHDVMSELRAIDRRPRVAVVVSGFDANEDIEGTLLAGFDAHLCKPTSGDDLLAIMAEGLRKRPSGIRPTQASATATATAAASRRAR